MSITHKHLNKQLALISLDFPLPHSRPCYTTHQPSQHQSTTLQTTVTSPNLVYTVRLDPPFTMATDPPLAGHSGPLSLSGCMAHHNPVSGWHTYSERWLQVKCST